nr:MAG TPA: hypothetical protein [Caudoviricetes sp.]
MSKLQFLAANACDNRRTNNLQKATVDLWL